MGADAGRASAIVVAGLVLAIAGCGLTADFSGLQGGTRDAGAADVSVPLADAAVDSGSPLGDGSVDTGSAGDAGFCTSLTTAVQFCDDFDEGQAIGAGWDDVDVYGGGSASLDFTYFSAPASFLSQIASTSGDVSARLQKDLPIDTPHVHFDFEMLVPAVSGNFELCVLHQPVASGTTYGIFYKLVNGNLELEVDTLDDDGGTSDTKYPLGPPPSDWLHVQIDADVSASATIVVSHDGTVVLNQSGVNTLTTTRASMFVELGYYSFEAASTLGHFDNVILDWQ